MPESVFTQGEKYYRGVEVKEKGKNGGSCMKKAVLEAPDWLAKAAIYQINPRTFSKEGTIKAVTKELPFLAELGFGVMYLCPVFEEDDSEDRTCWSARQKKSETQNPKNPYRMNDYFKIDSEYGTMEDLCEFIEVSHSLGMRVLLDLVYLHIGPNAPVVKKHPEFMKQDEEGNLLLGTSWPFALWDFQHKGAREYLWSNMVYYIGELDADGFRCDVGDQVPIDFWEEGRRRMQSIKPDAVLINEGADYSYLEKAFDASYCWNWHEDLYDMFCGKLTAAQVREKSEERHAGITRGGLLLRDIDNHDTVTDWPERTEIVAGHDGMEAILVINYFLDGIPMVYCGNELADSAKLNMFANRFHMGQFEVTDRSIASEDYSLRRQQIIKQLNQMKKTNPVLRWGETRWVDHDQPDAVIAFARILEGKQIVVIVNCGKEACDVNLIQEKAVDQDGSIPAKGCCRDLTDCFQVVMENGLETINGQKVRLLSHGYAVLESK